jgi:hypothetical protein
MPVKKNIYICAVYQYVIIMGTIWRVAGWSPSGNGAAPNALERSWERTGRSGQLLSPRAMHPAR